jgi:hypothetical protein
LEIDLEDESERRGRSTEPIVHPLLVILRSRLACGRKEPHPELPFTPSH